MTDTDVEDFLAAGVAFTDGRTILAGYQIHKENPHISGIGGKREAGENYATTAIREMVEELFHVACPVELVATLQKTLVPTKIMKNGTYVMIVYDFNTLQDLLYCVRHWGIHSPLYEQIPKTVHQLIFNRLEIPDAEISHLCLLPVIHHPKMYPFVDENLLDDIAILRGSLDGNGNT